MNEGHDSQGNHAPGREDDSPYDENGVDVSLIRWMLALTPAERLEVAQQAAASLTAMRDYSRRPR